MGTVPLTETIINNLQKMCILHVLLVWYRLSDTYGFYYFNRFTAISYVLFYWLTFLKLVQVRAELNANRQH